MAEKPTTKPSAAEHLWRISRDINAIGALVVAALAVVIPGPNVLLASWAGWNAVQAGGFELLREHAENRRSKK